MDKKAYFILIILVFTCTEQIFAQTEYRNLKTGYCPEHGDYINNLKGGEVGDCIISHTPPDKETPPFDPGKGFVVGKGFDELELENYEKVTSSDLGDLYKMMWSIVIKLETGIPQGVYRTDENYFVYVWRINDEVIINQKYKFDLDGKFLKNYNVQMEEVKFLTEKSNKPKKD